MTSGEPRIVTYRGKRLLDMLLALATLLVLLPVVVLVGLLVRLTMGGPVLFKQQRPGVLGRPFTIYKFRTMNDERGSDGRLLADRERMTMVGRVLRKTSLDELPELWNVLKGEMSLVGPRPLLQRYMPFFRERERLRFRALPGITGLAQVSGRNFLSWDERLELDVEYVEVMSLRVDLNILARTVITVLRREGMSVDVDVAETWLDEERSGQAPTSEDAEE